MNGEIVPIKECNLSVAWAKGFLTLLRTSHSALSPMVVSICGLNSGVVEEDDTVRGLLSQELEVRAKPSIETVANTIFPFSMWNQELGSVALYDRYIRAWPRIKRHPANRRGVYFQRFIAFENGNESVNQLQHIINTWHSGNHRHSALQAAVFDPRHDHTNSRRLGFPCLHQVSFSPVGPNGIDGLVVTGFYGTQHMFEKAYGNYLGLCRLGMFMAKEMGLALVQVNCIAALEKIGDVCSKSMFRELQEGLENALDNRPNNRGGTS